MNCSECNYCFKYPHWKYTRTSWQHPHWQGWEFAHLLICSFAHLLIRSDRTNQMNNCARIALDKWATVSDSLRLIMIIERMSNLLKTIWLKLYFSVRFIYVFLYKKMSHSFIPTFINERRERIAQVAHQKSVMWANHSGCSPKMSESLVFFGRIVHSLIFLQKTSDSLRKTMSEFPALVQSTHWIFFFFVWPRPF